MFHGHDEEAWRLMANSLRLLAAGKWREVSEAVDGVGFLTNFVGWFADDLDADESFRVAVGVVLRAEVDMEDAVDKLFSAAAVKKETVDRGWVNAEYCVTWGGMPTPADYWRWRALQKDDERDLDDPLVSYESFPGLKRVRPGIKDSEALRRRVGFKGKDRHAADVEGDGDACNKAFSIKCGLTQGVFNIVCPHVVTLGFRCLFRAESVGEALSIVLERFPSLPKVIFYDVACKLDKNALRRVRPIMRKHGVRCILDRPHSITHTCSAIYMPDESLGSTAGISTQAAEVSHSIAVANRTSLAYMNPSTYMIHKMVQVEMMNVRKLQRLASDNVQSENDHVPLAPFFHKSLTRSCMRGSSCSCQEGVADDGVLASDGSSPAMATSDNVGPTSAIGEEILMDMHETEPAVHAGRGDQEAPTAAGGAHGDGQLAAAAGEREAGGAAAEVGGAAVVHLSPLSTVPLLDAHQASLDARVGERALSAVVRARNRAKITLTVADFARLEGEKWFNDEAMNSFVGLINFLAHVVRDALARGTAASGQRAAADVPRAFMFNTFFFGRLCERVGCYDYAGVRSWGVKNGLIIGTVERVLIPVNLHAVHWVLVVVNVRERSLLFYDSLFGGGAGSVIETVPWWLRDEVVHQLGEEAAVEWDVESWL